MSTDPGGIDDPGAGAVRAEAVDLASPRTTAPFTRGGAPAALLISPVYAAGAPIDTAAQRRAAVRGYVSAVSDMGPLGARASRGLPSEMRLMVRDVDDPVIERGGVGDADGTIEVARRVGTVSVGARGTNRPSIRGPW